MDSSLVLTITPARHRDEEAIAVVFDAHGQGVLWNVVATGDGLLLEAFVGEGKVQLVPAVAFLQLVGGLSASNQEQHQQWQLQQDATQHVQFSNKNTCTICDKKKMVCFLVSLLARPFYRARGSEVVVVLVATWNSAQVAGAFVTVGHYAARTFYINLFSQR